MLKASLNRAPVALVALAGIAGSAVAQSDPSTFTTVYNIGNVPAGSPFDLPTAVTGTQVGESVNVSGTNFLTPTFLAGDTLDSNSQLNLFDGGSIVGSFELGPFSSPTVNSEINIFGGNVESLTVRIHTANILGGTFTDNVRARSGATFNISGGTFQSSFSARESSTLNVSGGSFGTFEQRSGSTANISGGSFGRLDTFSNSTTNISGGVFGFNSFIGDANAQISGGTFAKSFAISQFSTTEFVGTDFRFNNAPITQLTADIDASDDVFTGVLADGSVFIFTDIAQDFISASATTLTTTTVAPSTNPAVLASGTLSKGLRSGETLALTGTGELERDFAIVNATLNINGGSVAFGLETAASEINLSGGSIDSGANFYAGSTINISGGTLGFNARLHAGSVINITGGEVASDLTLRADSIANISGGIIGASFDAFDESVVNVTGGTSLGIFRTGDQSTASISGGSFNTPVITGSSTANISGGTFDNVLLGPDATINLIGTSFTLDGVPLTGLTLGDAFTITDRDVVLGGVLADGSAFSFNLNTDQSLINPVITTDFFDPAATLTVTLVPSPGAAAVLAVAGLAVIRRRRDGE